MQLKKSNHITIISWFYSRHFVRSRVRSSKVPSYSTLHHFLLHFSAPVYWTLLHFTAPLLPENQSLLLQHLYGTLLHFDSVTAPFYCTLQWLHVQITAPASTLLHLVTAFYCILLHFTATFYCTLLHFTALRLSATFQKYPFTFNIFQIKAFADQRCWHQPGIGIGCSVFSGLGIGSFWLGIHISVVSG